MNPTNVPTYSKVIGTSRSITGVTLTTGGGGGAAAPGLSPQAANAAANGTARRAGCGGGGLLRLRRGRISRPSPWASIPGCRGGNEEVLHPLTYSSLGSA